MTDETNRGYFSGWFRTGHGNSSRLGATPEAKRPIGCYVMFTSKFFRINVYTTAYKC